MFNKNADGSSKKAEKQIKTTLLVSTHINGCLLCSGDFDVLNFMARPATQPKWTFYKKE